MKVACSFSFLRLLPVVILIMGTQTGATSFATLVCENGSMTMGMCNPHGDHSQGIFPCTWAGGGGSCTLYPCTEVYSGFSSWAQFSHSTVCSIVCNGSKRIGMCHQGADGDQATGGSWEVVPNTSACDPGYEAVFFETEDERVRNRKLRGLSSTSEDNKENDSSGKKAAVWKEGSTLEVEIDGEKVTVYNAKLV